MPKIKDIATRVHTTFGIYCRRAIPILFADFTGNKKRHCCRLKGLGLNILIYPDSFDILFVNASCHLIKFLDKLHATVHLQLTIDVFDMLFHSARRDVKVIGHLFVSITIDEGAGYFYFAAG
jgi:hypothetical protein